MSKPITPNPKPITAVGLTLADICQLMTHCQKTGVAEFKLDELQFKMGNKTQDIITQENPIRVAQDLNAEVMTQKVQQADELLLSDPVAYEEAIEKAMQQESLPTDQPNSEAK
jgi:hypothetical protein